LKRATQARHGPQHGVDQPRVEPAPEPAVDGSPGRPSGRQSPPRSSHPQVPRNGSDHGQDRGAAPATGRVGALQPACDLLDCVAAHELLQARVVPHPVLLGPHRSPPRREPHDAPHARRR
jgi:hypothetical protein